MRQVSLRGVQDLFASTICPASLDTRIQISEDISEMRTQLRKQVNRVRELRIKKLEEPGKLTGLCKHFLSDNVFDRCILRSR